jgi:hypothetical protein
MKISGFTIAKNAARLYYPVKQSIQSILPIVDEFIVVLGDSDPGDETEKEITSIQSDKIKIIRTNWDVNRFPNGMEYARQTDIGKQACSGDWLFYLQCDEVVHEKYLHYIRHCCEQYLHNPVVEGFLFKYKHFWGDYEHYVLSHAWYSKEIRIIRNDPQIHSWRDAQSFRRIPDFDGVSYYQRENTSKLKVISIDAQVYHYGFVRPPHLMQMKSRNHNTNYRGEKSTAERFKDEGTLFNYGDLNKLNKFEDTHPAVMNDWIRKFDWAEALKNPSKRSIRKHELLKYRILTFLEQHLLNGRQLFGFKNYRIVGTEKPRKEFFPANVASSVKWWTTMVITDYFLSDTLFLNAFRTLESFW